MPKSTVPNQMLKLTITVTQTINAEGRPINGRFFQLSSTRRVLLQPEMEKRHVRVIVQLGEEFLRCLKMPQELHAP